MVMVSEMPKTDDMGCVTIDKVVEMEMTRVILIGLIMI